MNNPKIMFVANLLTSKIFLTQLVAAAATIATVAGVHPQWATEAAQAELVGVIDMLATTAFRLWGYSGPVALTAPLSTPPPQDLPIGTHTVTVTAPAVQPQPAASVTVVPAAPPV